MIKAVVFDMDGVLLDSEIRVIECWKDVANKHNIKDIEIPCRRALGVNATTTVGIFLDFYGQDFPYAEYKQEMRELFYERYSGANLPLKPYVEETLEYLKNAGYKLAVASSTREELVKRELSEVGILKYFEYVMCGDKVEKSKPDPEIFLKACAGLGVEPKEAIGIEDSFNGIRSCYAAGMHPIMVPDLVQPDEEIKAKAEKIFLNLREFRLFLENGDGSRSLFLQY